MPSADILVSNASSVCTGAGSSSLHDTRTMKRQAVIKGLIISEFSFLNALQEHSTRLPLTGNNVEKY